MQTLLIGSTPGTVVVPVSMVAEISGITPLEPSSCDHSAVLGDFRWRDFTVPLVDTAALLDSTSGDEDYQRIVILWPLKACQKNEFFALTSLGAPRVIESGGLDAPDEDDELPQLDNVLGYIRLDADTGIIPDLDRVARALF